jgi:transposase-like protein/IS1 family transposase
MTCLKCQHGTAKRFGKVGKAKVQRYRCRECQATFLEPRNRPLGTHYTDLETAARVVSLMMEGASVRSISRLLDIHKGTVLALLTTIGKNCRSVFDAKVRGIHPRMVQADELWSFVHSKEKHRRSDDPAEWGDAYLWIALDSDSKAVLSYHLGKRGGEDAYEFIQDLSQRVEGRFQINTDGMDAYIWPIEEHFGLDVSYAQLVKVYERPKGNWPDWYRPSKVVSTFRRVISGNPDESEISTSHVERFNLSVRTHLRRYVRLGSGFSKKFENLKAAVDVFMAWYMFCRPHSSLRVTPGIEAGLTDHIWTVEELLTAAT